MGYLIITASFIVAGLASLAAAITGYRGKVCERNFGYKVPARVAMDPALSKKANDLVAFWCSGGTILSLPPLIYLQAAHGQGVEAIPTGHLVAFAVYGFVLSCIVNYPFEKIKRLK